MPDSRCMQNINKMKQQLFRKKKDGKQLSYGIRFWQQKKRNSTKAKITSLFRFLTAIWYLGAFTPPQLTIPATELRFIIFPAAQSSSRFFQYFFYDLLYLAWIISNFQIPTNGLLSFIFKLKDVNQFTLVPPSPCGIHLFLPAFSFYVEDG